MRVLVLADRAERALDVADVGGVEHGPIASARGAGGLLARDFVTAGGARGALRRHCSTSFPARRSARGGRWRSSQPEAVPGERTLTTAAAKQLLRGNSLS